MYKAELHSVLQGGNISTHTDTNIDNRYCTEVLQGGAISILTATNVAKEFIPGFNWITLKNVFEKVHDEYGQCHLNFGIINAKMPPFRIEVGTFGFGNVHVLGLYLFLISIYWCKAYIELQCFRH